MKLHVRLVPAISVLLPEASSEVGHQFPDEGEERVVVGVLGDLQVPVDQSAEVVGEELGEDVTGEEPPQVQAVLQKQADELGSVLYESHKHDFPQVGRLRRESRERAQALGPLTDTQGSSFSATQWWAGQKVCAVCFHKTKDTCFIFTSDFIDWDVVSVPAISHMIEH